MTTDIQSNGHRAQATTREAPAYSIDDAMEETSRALHAVQAAGGDTRKLSAAHREGVLTGLCRALSLNPLTSPIIYLVLNGKEVLYVTRQATDQIAARLRLNRRTVSGPEVRDFGGTKMIFCQVEVTAPDGRSEMATATLPPGDLVNALMKCETKAKRRATLSIAGLGLLCEDELETIPGAHRTPRPDGDPRNTPPGDDDTADALTPPTCADLAGITTWYAALGLAADDSVRGDDAFGLATDHLIALGYLLSGAEIHRALSGRLPGVLCHVHDVLAAESTAEGVARAYGAVRSMVAGCEDGDLRAECKVAAARYYGGRHTPTLKGKAAQTALAAALAPKPTPPDGGGERPTAPQPMADAHGSDVAASNDSAAATARETRVVLDIDEAEARLLRSDATGDAAWAQHLVACVGVFAMAGAHHKRREAFGAAGVLRTRWAQTLAAIEAREGRGPEAARQALDGYATRRVMPRGVGEVIRLPQRTTAKRTGTEG